MADGNVQGLVALALGQMGTVVYKDTVRQLFDANDVQEVTKFVNEFMAAESFTFVGPPHLAEGTNDIALDNAHPSFWKVSTSADWKKTPTGLNTFDQFFPETASQHIKMNTQTVKHWAKLKGFLEIGSTCNLSAIYPIYINGKKRGRFTRYYESRLADLRVIPIRPAYDFRNLGTVGISMECETATPTEIIPMAMHIAPFSILVSDYVTESAVSSVAN